jgi:hypothetical protein
MGIHPNYFLDEMSAFELGIILDQYYKQYKDSWEQTRIISYYCAAPFTKIKMKDVMKFAWDKEEVIEEIPPEELELRKQYLMDIMNKAV